MAIKTKRYSRASFGAIVGVIAYSAVVARHSGKRTDHAARSGSNAEPAGREPAGPRTEPTGSGDFA